MREAPKPSNEAQRLNALRELEILDTPNEEGYDELVQLTSAILDVPISLVSFVDEERQWFKAKIGIPLEETPRDLSFCAYAILQSNVLVVEDATKDPRFCENDLVTGAPNIRFYAGAPIYSPDGHALGSLCVIDNAPRKISDEKLDALKTLAKQASRQIELRNSYRLLKIAKQELETRNAHLKRMMRVIAHDLRNPVGNLLNLSDLLSEAYHSMDSEEVTEMLRHINDSSHQTYSLLENLLEWASSVADMMNCAPQPTYFEKLFAQVETVVSPLVRQKKQKLIIDAPRDLLLRVDPRMIASVLRNLLSNASKFSKTEGTLHISAQSKGDHAEICVSDDGVGMEPAQIAQIMQHKTGVSTTGTLGEKGSGIGLELVHSFLEQHGAELTITSAPDQGAKFTFTLPLA